MNLSNKKEISEIKKILIDDYSEAKTELKYKNLYELLISVVLSAQCTDKRVNIVTPALFEAYPDTKKLAIAKLEDVKELIHSCTYYNNKAKNIIEMARRVEDVYKGTIPLEKEELITLAGVGNKTANVILIEYSNANVMAVDTHVYRTSHRLGLTDAKSVTQTEKDLVSKFNDELHILHQALVLFGRYICKAKRPLCEEKCKLIKYCKSKEIFKQK